MLQKCNQRMSLLARDGVDLLILRNAGQTNQNRDHSSAGQIKEGVFEFAVGIFFEVPQDTGVKLFFIQSRFEINLQTILMLCEITQMRAGREYQRPGNAKVREKHLSKLTVECLAGLVKCGKCDISEGKPLQLSAPWIVRFQRNERSARGSDAVAHHFCKSEAVAGGTGCRVAEPACTDNSGLAFNGF